MKKLLLILLSIYMLSCSNSNDSNTITYPKPEKGDLSVPSFTVTNPQYRREGNYLYFDFVQFEGDIEGFTKIDHNVFKANETREYKLDMKLRGSVKFKISAGTSETNFYLEVKAGNTSRYIKSDMGTDPINKERTLRLNQGDTLSFRVVATALPNPKPISLKNTYLEINFQELSSGQADF